ncbi:MAG: HlyD family secretion protein, partial [Gammaproteobacteria bacterium]|nr:HlyD family secretion protein [Gammaproteobacteria bacterium]
MNNADSRLVGQLAQSEQDHNASGIEILVSEPAWQIRGTVITVVALLAAGVAWAFVGKADVVVQANGVLAPLGEVRQLYAPVDGELIESFMVEGSQVTKGDVLARINAPAAVQLATVAADARLKLAAATRKKAMLPERLRVMHKREQLISQQVETEERLQEARIAEALPKVKERQTLKLEKTLLELERARQEMTIARKEWEAHKRLLGTEAGGGVSRKQVREKEANYRSKRSAFRLKENALGEFEAEMRKEKIKAEEEIQTKNETLQNLRLRLLEQRQQIEQAEIETENEFRAAKATLRGAERITFDDLDEDTFLLVRAPVTGILTNLPLLQKGVKVESKKPIAGIAPAKARMVFEMEVPERDRGFLREGMPVKLKLNAFPFQRHGIIEGKLEYIAPTTSPSEKDAKRSMYRARASIAT